MLSVDNIVMYSTSHQMYDDVSPDHTLEERNVPEWINSPTEMTNQMIKSEEGEPRPTETFWNASSNQRVIEMSDSHKLREEAKSEGECTEVDSEAEEKSYPKEFSYRQRFNIYNPYTGDPFRDNEMYTPMVPCQYYCHVPQDRCMQLSPSCDGMNDYDPLPMMRNEPRHVYHHEPLYPTEESMDRRRKRARKARPRRKKRPLRINRKINRLNALLASMSFKPDIDRYQMESQYSSSLMQGWRRLMFQSVNVQPDESRSSRKYLQRRKAPIEFSLQVRNISPEVRVCDLKAALNNRGIKPRNIIWKGYSGYAILHFVKRADKEVLNADKVIKLLEDLPLPPKDDKMLVIEPLVVKKQESGDFKVRLRKVLNEITMSKMIAPKHTLST